MAYKNFIPELWAEKIQRENEKFLVMAQLCNREYEGKIKKVGDTVHILGIGSPNIGDYTPGTPINGPETLEDMSVPLRIDKAKYFNVMVDDIDRRQAVEGMLETVLQEASEGLATQEDSDISAKVAKEVKSAQKITVASCTDSGTTSARYFLQQAKTKLFKAGVKKNTEIVAVVSPEFLERVEREVEKLDTDNSGIVTNGFVGKTAGINLYMSNNVYKTSSDVEQILVMTRRAIAHASQINEVKSYSPEDYFADAVKGLNVYGTKLVRPKELVAIEVSEYA